METWLPNGNKLNLQELLCAVLLRCSYLAVASLKILEFSICVAIPCKQ